MSDIKPQSLLTVTTDPARAGWTLALTLTDLDYFAGQALAVLAGWEAPASNTGIAVEAYNIAEAMLAERQRRIDSSK